MKKPDIEKLQANIFYSTRYYDDIYEYRLVDIVPPFGDLLVCRKLNKDAFLKDASWKDTECNIAECYRQSWGDKTTVVA